MSCIHQINGGREAGQSCPDDGDAHLVNSQTDLDSMELHPQKVAGSLASAANQPRAARASAMSPDLATQPTRSSAPTQAAQPTAAHTARDGKGILISEPAMRQLAALVRQEGTQKVLRVGVRSGGCSGMSYTMDFVETGDIRDDDERYVYEPADSPSFEVVCDPKSLLYIYGMQLDFSSALIGGGFNFSNPNATQTCGCGSSFAV